MAFPKCEFCGDAIDVYGDARMYMKACVCDKRYHFPWMPMLAIFLTFVMWAGCWLIYGCARHWYLFVLLACAINFAHEAEKLSWKVFFERIRKWST